MPAPCTPALIGKHRRKAAASDVLTAVAAVLDHELSEQGATRWRALLDVELARRGCTLTPAPARSALVPTGDGAGSRPRAAVPLALPLARPGLTAAVLESFGSREPLQDGKPVRVAPAGCIGVERLEKLVAKRAVEWLRTHKGNELLQPGGELDDAVLSDKARLARTLDRCVSDTLAYLNAKAAAMRGESDSGAVLQLHAADDTLGGKALRGSGLVFCEKGAELFERALAEAALSLQNTRTAVDAAAVGRAAVVDGVALMDEGSD